TAEEKAEARGRPGENAAGDPGQRGAAASGRQKIRRAPQGGMIAQQSYPPLRRGLGAAARRARGAIGAAVASALLCGSPAAAESWPARPLTMVVPFAPGGGTDVLGRIVGRRLSE